MTTTDGWISLSRTIRSRTSFTTTTTTALLPKVAVLAGVAYGESGTIRAGMGADAGDYDHSGSQGLVVGNFTNEGLALYHNDGSGLFSDESLRSGVSEPSLNL